MTDIMNIFESTSVEMLRCLRETVKMFARKYRETAERVSRWKFACNVYCKCRHQSPLLRRMSCNTNPYILLYMYTYYKHKSNSLVSVFYKS